MITTQVNINSKINSSLQIGDFAFVSKVKEGGIIEDPVRAGKITEINTSGLKVLGEAGIITDPSIPSNPQQFFSFAKDIRANESSLKGYYADVTFKNTSNYYAELFAISSDIVPSSK